MPKDDRYLLDVLKFEQKISRDRRLRAITKRDLAAAVYFRGFPHLHELQLRGQGPRTLQRMKSILTRIVRWETTLMKRALRVIRHQSMQ